jgi:hypothetical protein
MTVQCGEYHYLHSNIMFLVGAAKLYPPYAGSQRGALHEGIPNRRFTAIDLRRANTQVRPYRHGIS